MKKEIICTVCPRGCHIMVEGDGKNVVSMDGYGCKRGVTYAEAEYSNPVRILTTTVKVEGKANELFQSILKAEFLEQWTELEKQCTTDRYSCLPYVATNYTHMIHSPARRERDSKKHDMERRAKEQFNELVMEVELGGIKKDEVMAMIAKMNLEG